jgi:hypothetical protein
VRLGTVVVVPDHSRDRKSPIRKLITAMYWLSGEATCDAEHALVDDDWALYLVLSPAGYNEKGQIADHLAQPTVSTEAGLILEQVRVSRRLCG